jgi:hypothetical protein
MFFLGEELNMHLDRAPFIHFAVLFPGQPGETNLSVAKSGNLFALHTSPTANEGVQLKEPEESTWYEVLDVRTAVLLGSLPHTYLRWRIATQRPEAESNEVYCQGAKRALRLFWLTKDWSEIVDEKPVVTRFAGEVLRLFPGTPFERAVSYDPTENTVLIGGRDGFRKRLLQQPTIHLFADLPTDPHGPYCSRVVGPDGYCFEVSFPSWSQIGLRRV